MGDLDTARRNLWVAVDRYKAVDLDQCRITLRSLAKLERDPEREALMIYLSCQGTAKNRINISFNLLEAYWVCEQSDTPKLAEYYLARLWNEYPAKAKEYSDKHRLSTLEESP